MSVNWLLVGTSTLLRLKINDKSVVEFTEIRVHANAWRWLEGV
jgi:hypothetical protein